MKLYLLILVILIYIQILLLRKTKISKTLVCRDCSIFFLQSFYQAGSPPISNSIDDCVPNYTLIVQIKTRHNAEFKPIARFIEPLGFVAHARKLNHYGHNNYPPNVHQNSSNSKTAKTKKLKYIFQKYQTQIPIYIYSYP